MQQAVWKLKIFTLSEEVEVAALLQHTGLAKREHEIIKAQKPQSTTLFLQQFERPDRRRDTDYSLQNSNFTLKSSFKMFGINKQKLAWENTFSDSEWTSTHHQHHARVFLDGYFMF